jgi:iron-sulfur cluster assembly protein
MTEATPTIQRGIQLTPVAFKHIKMLQEQQGKELCLRVGVRQGGCSGMSYMMDFEEPEKISDSDEVLDYDGIQIV